jgi:hypothetical protein
MKPDTPESPTVFPRMIDVVREYLAEYEWDCEEETRSDGGTCFMAGIRMKNGIVRVFMDVYGDGDRFTITAYPYPYSEISQEHLAAVALYSVYLNNNRLARLELDLSDGVYSMKAGMLVKGSFLNRETIRILEILVVNGMDEQLDILQEITRNGRSPKEAFELYCKRYGNT